MARASCGLLLGRGLCGSDRCSSRRLAGAQHSPAGLHAMHVPVGACCVAHDSFQGNAAACCCLTLVEIALSCCIMHDAEVCVQLTSGWEDAVLAIRGAVTAAAEGGTPASLLAFKDAVLLACAALGTHAAHRHVLAIVKASRSDSQHARAALCLGEGLSLAASLPAAGSHDESCVKPNGSPENAGLPHSSCCGLAAHASKSPQQEHWLQGSVATIAHLCWTT